MYQSQTGVRLRTRAHLDARTSEEGAKPDAELSRVLSTPDSKDYRDLCDRAAYVMITGTFPTHLRPHMTGLLRKVSHYSLTPAALDGRAGSMGLDPAMAARLGLTQHPMVAKAKEFVDQGYLIQASREVKARRPFSRVFLYKIAEGGEVAKITVHLNGAVLDGWSHA
jgi:hypothetical protein